MALRHKSSLAALVLLTLATLYGVFHEKLLAQDLLSPLGRQRSLVYALIYWIAAAALLWLAPRWVAPRWLGAAAAILAAVYTIWWTGPAAPLAVLYLLGSFLLTGRILVRRAEPLLAIALGLALWIAALWIALHYPVNTRAIYFAAFAIPYIWESRRLREHFSGFRLRCDSRAEAACLAVLLFLLLAHLLVALMPEVSADGLSMHLALPMKVAHEGRWAFDFQRETWTLMPAGGDCLYTAAYLLAGESGGEAAARLTNFALLALIAAMIVRTSRRWMTLGQAFLAAALFASTPLVELVTGSLFVENLWALLILGAALALVRFDEETDDRDLQIAGALFGAALAVKLMAVVFLAPAAAIAATLALRRRRFHALFAASWWMLVLGVPTYLYALVQSGNPVFPFANTIFRSPYFDTAQPFSDARFVGLLQWHIPYDLTFHSERFFEGQNGAAGFQYFLLLLPAVLLIRKRPQWLLLAIGGGGMAILLAVLPNLRYLYPALPLLSIVLASMLSEWPRRSAAGFAVVIIAANFWFLGSSGWYHKEFAFFRKSEAAQYLNRSVPEKTLIARLNREAPGETAAFFSTGAVAGLYGRAYTDSWHNNAYWVRLLHARSAGEIAGILREYDIRHIVAPASLKAQFPLMETFLREWAEPDGPANGSMALFRLRETKQTAPVELGPFSAGEWDDLDERIEYNGAWMHDRQFSETLNQSVSYSGVPGDWLRLSFTGTGITYVFTEALNRGIALVSIDGKVRARIDQYSRETKWQSSRAFDGLGTGTHTFEVRIVDGKNGQSSGTFVDLDGIVVRP